ncbi:MAG: restriction endonuclease [Prolixibacteraceae bacterium]|nr:restriction endonuclease [Prolixibacteraceae bacterium]
MTNHKHSPVLITKASGEQEPFSPQKLAGSLERSGADSDIIDQIVSDIQSWITDGMNTHKIYKHAFSLLRSRKYTTASRYKLKQAIMELGNTGYPFEHLVSRVMETQGYKTQTGIVVQGRCITHEVDVIATNHKKQILVECKYAQDAGKPVSVKVPLYIHSRVEDIIKKRETLPEFKDFSFTGSIATNTRFTSDAIDYGKCNDMFLLAWDYPKGNGLKDIIDREKIYPVTVLNKLTKAHKQKLMDSGIVICRQITASPDVLKPLQMNDKRTKDVLDEILQLTR